MAQQRPSRFRLPWFPPPAPARPLRPAVVTQPPTVTRIPIPPTSARQPPSRPPGQAPEQPQPTTPPVAPPSSNIEMKATTTESPSTVTSQTSNEIESASEITPPKISTVQPDDENKSKNETTPPATPSQRPPLRSPGLAQTVSSSPQAQVLPRNESPPVPSPSPPVTQSRPPTQPPSSSRLGSLSRVPSRPTSTSRAASQTSSPSRREPSRTPTLPRSSSRLASQPTGKTPSSPSSSAPPAAPILPPEDSATQPPSSSEKQTAQEDSPPSSNNTQQPVPEKELEPTTSQSEPTMPQPSEQISNNNVSDFIKVSQPLQTADAEERIQKTIVEPLNEMSRWREQKEEEQNLQSKAEQKQETTEMNKNVIAPVSERENETLIPHPVEKSSDNEQQKPTTSTISGSQVPLHKEIKDEISKLVHKMTTGQQNLPVDDKSVSVITLAGENRGSSMHLDSETTKREGKIHIRRGYKTNPEESPEATDGDGRSLKASKNIEDETRKAFINSNIQGINNSIMLKSSISERNAGVHLCIYSSVVDHIHPKGTTDFLEARKSEFKAATPQNLTYEPIVRRRCLRGLLLESSDSDPDNQKKHRRHGCRVNCKGKSKDVNQDFS